MPKDKEKIEETKPAIPTAVKNPTSEKKEPKPVAVDAMTAAKLLKKPAAAVSRIEHYLKTQDIPEIHGEHTITKWKDIFRKL